MVAVVVVFISQGLNYGIPSSLTGKPTEVVYQ